MTNMCYTWQLTLLNGRRKEKEIQRERKSKHKTKKRKRNERCMLIVCFVWGDYQYKCNRVKRTGDGGTNERRNYTEKTHKQLQIYMLLYVYSFVTKNYHFFCCFLLDFFLFLLHFHLPFEKNALKHIAVQCLCVCICGGIRINCPFSSMQRCSV